MSAQIDHPDLLFVYKPSGISSHRPSPEHQGFVEWWQDKLKTDLYVCHRLDKETSGAMVFAKSKKAAQKLTELFSQQQVTKEYLFVSDKKSQFEKWVVFEDRAQGTHLQECPVQKKGVGYQSLTEIRRISGDGPLYLYKALPKTGKTHQIRKHAVHSQVPILGDKEYGGKVFPRLMLHCLSLQFQYNDNSEVWKCEPSSLFKDLSLCQNQQVVKWMESFDRRKILFPELIQGEECVRLFHKETGDLRGDKVGDKLVLGWWKSDPPNEKEKSQLKGFIKTLPFKDWIFQWRPGTQDPSSTAVQLEENISEESHWVFSENSVMYQACLDRGQNFGLFLDQRDRRRWVRENSNGKKVLNLFAFTGGFSVNAALGGATEIETVDLFPKYLEWTQENFLLNDLDPKSSRFHFRKIDSLEFLKIAKKKGRHFDIIICDPPSFSRNKKQKSVFRIERDYKELLELCLSVLAPQGTLLFSNNYEKWDLAHWRKELQAFFTGYSAIGIAESPSQWDYEWQKKDSNLKAFFIHNA